MEENNKLIAEFDCWKLSSDGVTYMNPQDQDDCWLVEDMLFHTSWEWLMPVVDKIESLGFKTSIEVGFCSIEDTANDVYFESMGWNQTKLDVTCQAVVEFINFYNQNKNVTS